MAIKFICSCGKHLRARDEMAARRSFCPQCGAPVGIPSLKPTVRGVPAAPMSPHDRLRTKRAVPKVEMPTAPTAPAAEDASKTSPIPPGRAGRALDFSLVRMMLGRRHIPRKPSWPLETTWYHCLLFPFRAWPLVIGLAVAMTALSGATPFILPEMMLLPGSDPGFWVLCCSWFLIAGVIAGYVVGSFDCILASALAGEVGEIRWPGESLKMALRSLAIWLVCFIVGPVIPAGIGLAFWLNGGDAAVIDWFILAELVVVTFGYWLLAVVAAGRKDRLLDANPIAVAELVVRLGAAGMTTTIAMSLLSLPLLVGLYMALDRIHTDAAKGWPLLFGCWVSVVFAGTYLMRFLGIRCHHSHLENEDLTEEEAEVESE